MMLMMMCCCLTIVLLLVELLLCPPERCVHHARAHGTPPSSPRRSGSERVPEIGMKPHLQGVLRSRARVEQPFRTPPRLLMASQFLLLLLARLVEDKKAGEAVGMLRHRSRDVARPRD